MHLQTLPYFNALKILYFSLALCLVFLYFYFGFQGFDLVKIWQSFYQSDFYINYEGGFVRRGLDGQIIYKLSKMMSLNAVLMQKIYNLATFLIFIGFLGSFIKKYRPPFFALFSTSVVLLFVFYLGRGIRKDHILLIFFLLFCFKLTKKGNKIFIFFTVNFLFAIGSLIHELFFIISFFPAVFLLKNFTFKQENISAYLKSILFLLPSIVVFLFIFFFGLGNSVQEKTILESWKQIGVENIIFNAGIFDRSLYIWELGFTKNQYISFIVAVILHFAFVFIMIINDLKNRKLKINFCMLLILQYVVLLVLSIVAKDFSRWIFLCNFTAIAPIYILKRQRIYRDSELTKTFSFINKIYWFPYILFFINTMPHSGWSFNDYVVYNPVNIAYKIITKKPIF